MKLEKMAMMPTYEMAIVDPVTKKPLSEKKAPAVILKNPYELKEFQAEVLTLSMDELTPIERAEQMLSLQRRRVACSVVGWANIDGSDGKPLEFSEANKALLFEQVPYLFEQIMGALDKLENFMQS